MNFELMAEWAGGLAAVILNALAVFYALECVAEYWQAHKGKGKQK